jgi:uncharacterized membrane protein YkvA (DUF1232 family)
MEQKRKRGQTTRNIGFFKQLWEQMRLGWRLMLDARVPTKTKVIPLVALAYVISPIDLIPDIFPLLGQLDDLGLFFTALSVFINLAPADVTAEHTAALRNEQAFKVNKTPDGKVIIDVKPKNRMESDETPDSTEEESPRKRNAKTRNQG